MNQPTNNININLDEVESITCDSCGKEEFSPVFKIKRLSPLVSPNGQETYIPIQLFKCDGCSHINALFLEGITN